MPLHATQILYRVLLSALILLSLLWFVLTEWPTVDRGDPLAHAGESAPSIHIGQIRTASNPQQFETLSLQ
jgi:hypothetical protein